MCSKFAISDSMTEIINEVKESNSKIILIQDILDWETTRIGTSYIKSEEGNCLFFDCFALFDKCIGHMDFVQHYLIDYCNYIFLKMTYKNYIDSLGGRLGLSHKILENLAGDNVDKSEYVDEFNCETEKFENYLERIELLVKFAEDQCELLNSNDRSKIDLKYYIHDSKEFLQEYLNLLTVYKPIVIFDKFDQCDSRVQNALKNNFDLFEKVILISRNTDKSYSVYSCIDVPFQEDKDFSEVLREYV